MFTTAYTKTLNVLELSLQAYNTVLPNNAHQMTVFVFLLSILLPSDFNLIVMLLLTSQKVK